MTTNWTFKGKELLDDDIKGYEGFVYIITNLTTKEKYIGRKYFKSLRKQKGKTRRSSSESNWKEYWSSSDVLKEQVKELGKEKFKREILCLCKTRGDTNYMEVFYQFQFDVLANDKWLNENIAGKWHRKPTHIKEARNIDEKLLIG